MITEGGSLLVPTRDNSAIVDLTSGVVADRIWNITSGRDSPLVDDDGVMFVVAYGKLHAVQTGQRGVAEGGLGAAQREPV